MLYYRENDVYRKLDMESIETSIPEALTTSFKYTDPLLGTMSRNEADLRFIYRYSVELDKYTRVLHILFHSPVIGGSVQSFYAIHNDVMDVADDVTDLRDAFMSYLKIHVHPRMRKLLRVLNPSKYYKKLRIP